jgi:type II secretory pathway pseudopilin PulG
MNRSHRRGFTLVELIVAGVIAVLVLGAVTFSLSQLGRARNVTFARLESSMRARAALEAVRRDIAGVIRDADLLKCRVLVTDGSAPTAIGIADRDELLLFSTKLQATRDVAYSGEGIEYETHYRIEEDDAGPVLWQRRDFMPDGYPDAGGVAVPVVEGVLGFAVEAYDGVAWFEEWDSDLDGLPWALRITITSLPDGVDPSDPDPKGLVTLRTLVPIDRIVPPPQEDEEEEAMEDANAAAGEDGGLGGADGGEGEAIFDDVGGAIPGDVGGGRGGRGGRPGAGGGSGIGSGGGGAGGQGGRGGGRGGPGSTSGPRFEAGPGGINPNATVGRGSRSSRLGSTRPANGGS